MDAMQIQKIVDELRGELDKENHQEPGFSGPITDAYMTGYGKHGRDNQHIERETHTEIHCNHGWHT